MSAVPNYTTGPSHDRDLEARAFARRLEEFTVADLAEHLEVQPLAASTRIERWMDEGICRMVRRTGRTRYFAMAQAGAQQRSVAKGPRSDEEALWRAMRLLRQFDATDLVASTALARPDIEVATARSYCQFLTRAGYLRCVRPARGEREATYSLVRNTGPVAPFMRRVRVLVDPNEGGIAWTPEVEV